jgi:hypothetical protein
MLCDQLLEDQMRIFLVACELEMLKVGLPTSLQTMDNMGNTWRTTPTLSPVGKKQRYFMKKSIDKTISISLNSP